MTTTITMHIGDVHDVQPTLEDHSFNMVLTSPPFIALRSYLPDDHPDKEREIGQATSPEHFLSTLLGLTEDWRRLLTEDGTLAVELGDTYSGSGGQGGDYGPGGKREGAPGFMGSARQYSGDWPLGKSLCLMPTLYPGSLAYGRNLLSGHRHSFWRVRNLLTWTKPNPPVGQLFDKFRPATSFVTVACTGDRRWFDLDAVREPHKTGSAANQKIGRYDPYNEARAATGRSSLSPYSGINPNGAPPLDWWEDDLEGWQPFHDMATTPYPGAHFAAFPVKLPERLIRACCPPQGVVLDPFGGTGSTAVAAARADRNAVLIDIDARNAALTTERVHQSLRVLETEFGLATVRWTVEPPLPFQARQSPGQLSIYDALGA